MANTKTEEKTQEDQVVEEVQIPEVKLCGHINRHSIGADGKPDNLACTLPEGHVGLHQAPHYEIATQISGMLDADESMQFTQRTDGLLEGTIMRSWNDQAGIPADQIKPRTPGQHLVSADHMFPEVESQRISELEEKIAKLEQLLNK